MFSTSEEYETALIEERRAQGQYSRRRNWWPGVVFIACAAVIAGTVLLFG